MIILIVANRHSGGNLTLSITIVLAKDITVRNCKSNDYMRVGIDLFGGRACLPIANVGNKTGVLAMGRIVVESRSGWIGSGSRARSSGQRRAGSVGAWPVLAAVVTIRWSSSAPLING